jgi:outer membrane lipoprotein-sorting protein
MKRLLLILSFPVVLHAAPLPDQEAVGYLEKLAASRPQKSATVVHFRETRTSPMLTKPAVSEGELYFQPPDRFRREETAGNVMVSDGATLSIYTPANREVERYKLGSKNADAFKGLIAVFNLQDVARLFNFTVEREGGMSRITLVPKRKAGRRMFEQMVLDVGTDQKLRTAVWTSPNGERTEMIFSNERPAGKVSFEFQPPAGVKVTTPLGR